MTDKRSGEDIYGEQHKESNEPIFSGIPTFLKLPQVDRDQLAAEDVDIGIIGAPLDTATTIRPGTRYGPRAVRAASTVPSPPYEHFNIETGVDPFDTFSVADTGDAAVSPGETRQSQLNIEDAVAEVSEQATPIVIGGDHSISHPDIKGWAEANGYDDIGLVHFDCHADTGENGLTGFDYDHGAWVKRVYDEGIMDGENYTLIGPRGFWPGPDTYEGMRKADMKWYTSMQVGNMDLDEIVTDAVQRATDGTDAVWVSFDVDVMDPAYAPGTGEPEPGGLLPREAIYMIREVVKALDPEDFGFDVVEVSPAYDTSDTNSYNGGVTSGLANRLIIEVMGSMALAKQGLIEGSPITPKESPGPSKPPQTADD
ncbi:agmatinase family protein [Haloquadratum walsbyi]|jgi:Arginase/agmatinase/formimionoglutamate hydrolase, arginase family|uniref:Arginase/agmatinase/formimionoglutamate hydrolase, arginase family n=1 Tax=Haloquadratum walsbyi J07HQW2 TaxID=1238425 RepID=U1NG26_9EURY|nr:agmatinase family protein [Haloquadratum walsbyi]ERG96060.1 MAG: arginase/agmatinase/formimionoglutamate hydrolase, arginase family [Haloquadratum walsbyi J07HQW2]